MNRTRHTYPRIPAVKAACCIAAGLLSLAGLCAGEPTPAKQIDLKGGDYTVPAFGQLAPVELELFQNGKWKTFDAKATKDGLEIIVDAMGAAIMYPWDGMEEVKFQRKLDPSVSKVIYSDDSYSRARDLATEAELLLPFAGIPEASAGGIHSVIHSYLTALLEEGQIQRAYEMTQGMDLRHVPESIALDSYKVVEALFADQAINQGEKLLTQLSQARPSEEFANNSLDLAERLTVERHFNAALSIYEPLLQIVGADEKKAVALDCAYLALETGATGKYRQFRTIADQASGGSEEDTAATWILDGILAYNEDPEESRLVLRQIGHALALLSSDSKWKEIALYYNYKAYQRQGNAEIAASILEELKLVYSKSAYTKDLTS